MPDDDRAATSTDAQPGVADDQAEPFAEVLDAATVLDELADAARVEAWASSALGVWAEAPDAADHDAAFASWLAAVAATTGPMARRAALVRHAIDALRAADPTVADLAIDSPPPWVGHVGTAAPTRAWRVTRNGVESIGIGFVSSDGSEHSLLADLHDRDLAAIIIAPGPDELFDGSEDLVAPEPLGVDSAATRIVDAWREAIERGDEPPESVYVNGALARARLAALAGVDPDALRFAAVTPPSSTPTAPDAPAGDEADEAERRATDRWACSVLDGAIGSGGSDPTPSVALLVEAALDALDPERIARQPALEREAYDALEWADWLGVVIQAVRSGPGTTLDPDAMVDAVNRCPEVTSSIPRADRPYYAWAFSLVLALWRRAGIVDEAGTLSADGVEALPAALRRSWGALSDPGPGGPPGG